ncbi:GntR family transcriptional regulator [Microbacterium thalassium]|uniref:DNA-binding GntR family transcriptional regulator n=1 Tax=Microbacterium thalassium TaxID=362649 RepID=A0A7X0FP92_9MICO|nr:GntR family transcriptional regulator [Microbacterium thalassium]MBB6390655.1 DNA-binding GntR family transcriptional regulator [Microbacterium thalassium]GLK25764.1 GntR family transcriptional regulator [Microbacterium thalassium]
MSASPAPDEDVRADLTQQIREAILGGKYAPNQRLIEADISDEYGVSRAAVRTALLHLSGEGLVERLPNKGARVRSISVAEAVEIVEVRIGLESLCARKAAELITDAEADELRQLRAEIIESVETGQLLQYSRLNHQLDERLREISAHATAVQLLERLRAQSARHQFRLALHPGRAAVSAPEHAAIIDAVVAHDPDGAEAATRHHLEGIIAVLHQLE